MKDYLVTPSDAKRWLFDLASRHPLFFPAKWGERSYRFQKVEPGFDIQFDHYSPTVVPPGKLLMPARDELIRFKKKEDGGVEVIPCIDASFRIVAGVRPCDLKGIYLLDLLFKDGIADPHYLARRENTAVIGYACNAPCDDRSFCVAVDSLDHRAGADVFLTLLKGGEILLEAMTDKGTALIQDESFLVCDDGPARKVGEVAARNDAFGRSWGVDVSEIFGVVEKKWQSPVWDAHVERCFSCGTCNVVCPTCYCFDVSDDLNLDVHSGNRTRTWDGCMLPHFAEVAGGHNFRSKPAARQRHRVKRKFEYLTKKLGHGAVCVGCGRCGRQCTSHIDIFDIVDDLLKEEGAR